MCEKFETISQVGKGELSEFRQRRVQMFRKNLTELAELEIKHAKAKAALFQEAINGLKAVGWKIDKTKKLCFDFTHKIIYIKKTLEETLFKKGLN